MKNLKYFLKPFLWLIIICIGLFLPSNNLPHRSIFHIPHADKIVHFMLFFVLCLLFSKAFKNLNMNYLYFPVIITIFLSALLEFIQHKVSSSRSSDILDFFANAAGAIIALFFYLVFISGKKWEKLL